MQKNYKMLFLQQSYKDSYENYCNSLKDSIRIWDYVVLTASNEMQATSYREQLDYRINKGYLSQKTKYMVVADRDGKRVGSGGATLSVLKSIADERGSDDFGKLRILCIHSGGDSKRVPQYSACGKIFSPVPRTLPDGRCSTLFDECVIAMAGVPDRIDSGLVVCSGDVLLLFNSLQIDFYGEGAAALSVKEKVEIGQNHGVFLGGENGFVKEFLHKQSEESLRKKGAVDQAGLVNLDTGVVIFSGGFVSDLYSLVDSDGKFDELVNDRVQLSLYADFLYPLAENSTLEDFKKEKPEGEFCDELDSARIKIWNLLNGYGLKLINCSPASFLHFGTTNEVLNLMTHDISDYQHLEWKMLTNTNYNGSDFSVYNSYINPNSKIGKGCYIENSDIGCDVVIGENSVVSGVKLEHVIVPSGVVLHGLKLNGGKFAARLFGVKDNPKEKFLNGRELGEILWSKEIFPVRKTMKDAVNAVLSGDTSGELISLEQSFNAADVKAILPWTEKLSDKIAAKKIVEAITAKVSVDDLISLFSNGISDRTVKYLTVIADSLDENNSNDFYLKIRIYYYLSKLSDNVEVNDKNNKCFETIKKTALQQCRVKKKTKLRAVSDSVTISLPVRVNFAGGWSDTMPYCMENGGTVLNASVKLNGAFPIESTVRKSDKPGIVFESTDIGSYRECYSVDELALGDVSDPFEIHKSALIACGIVNGNESTMSELLESIGGGIYINTRVIGIPKGSGLGTSSILSAACVKCISGFFGLNFSEDDVVEKVLHMEQLMSTGGGWQDQIGGIVNGIKMITSLPSLNQKVHREQLNIADSFLKELNDRFVLIYTGQRRLARKLLRNVMGKYVGNDPVICSTLYRVQQIALLMKFELERSNIDGFCELLNEQWDLAKKIDSGCTNTCIEQIFMAIDDLIQAKMICGAGGGGFLQVVLKEGATKKMLSDRLDGIFADSGVCVWESDLYMG